MASMANRVPAAFDRDYQMLIDGEWTGSSTGETLRCVDPFDLHEWAQIPAASAEDVDRAVAAARRAFDQDGWPQRTPQERAALLRKLADRIEAHCDELARMQVHENGKLMSEMFGGARAMVPHARYVAGLAENAMGHSVEALPGFTSYTVKEALGVVAAILPWNTPLGLLSWKLFPALAAGCTIVIKPSEVTSASTLRLAELCQEVGFPRGVVNVVTGHGQPTGAALANHPGVDKIAFTGSTGGGKAMMAASVHRVGRTTLELGGKSPNIVFADADLDDAIHGVMAGIFAATGQSCMAGSRVLVEASIHDAFVERLCAAAAKLKLGDPLAADTDMGPVACRNQYAKVQEYIAIGKAEGATLANPELADALPDTGLFVPPTIFTGVAPRSRLAQEEIFGPVCSVIRFEDEDDAVRIANDISLGLAAAAWTQNVGRAHRMVKRLRAGTVWINAYRVAHYTMPFGGFKESGLGRELGPDALDPYTETKSVWINNGAVRQSFGRKS
ncbi:aldehyde dehydrogenase family protein [Sphingomonas sp. 37zxx]|uniref:aldehyde dehydrogenase family protein n=1 Tax=Sphingomonas sp. 37zxx TaxID=1550073 RepID=UPI0018CF3090|nr:aldehyde dehydrogenase family protein [Sphingomonas sp. 37zxx]